MEIGWLREKYYDECVNHNFAFRGVDGLDYEGYLDDWYEDGTLVFGNLKLISLSYEKKDDGADCSDFESMGCYEIDDSWILVDAAFIRFIFAYSLAYDSDKMTVGMLAERDKRWERKNYATRRHRD